MSGNGLIISHLAAVAGGFALCWFFKDKAMKLFMGAQQFADAMRKKAADVESLIKK